LIKQISPVPARELLEIQPPDPGRLAEQVVLILAGKSEKQEKINRLLQLTVGLVNAAGAVFFMERAGVLSPAGQLLSRQAASLSEDILGECREGARQALASGKASIVSLVQMPAARIFSCPVLAHEDSPACCFSVLVLLGENPREPFLIIFQLMAAALSLVEGKSASPQLSLDNSPDVLHFLCQGKDAPSQRQFSEFLRQWSACTLLAIGVGRGGGRLQLQTISDVVKIDSRTSSSRLHIKVMQECLSRKQPIGWPGSKNGTGYEESLLVKELVLATGMRQGAAVSLPGGDRGVTVLIFLWTEELSREKQLTEIIRIAPLLGLILPALETAGPQGPEKVAGRIFRMNKAVLTGVVLLLLLGLALFPKNFVLHPDCQISPVQVLYVVTHFDGLLEKVFVAPGDRVEQGEELALLDGREIAMELRSIAADSAKALKMRDNYLVSGNVASAQISLLEYEHLQERAKLLKGHEQQLSLQSPVNGIVLSGDLKRSEGGPVAKGQLLFEVAPLDTVLLELAVPDADVSYVRKGMEVTVRFNAFPQRKWQGKVERITPKSELVQGQNVFIASLEIANADNILQPGMQGQAAVRCGRKSLSWVYFHKPWYALRRLLVSLF